MSKPSSISSPAIPSTFHLFPLLPIEIRLRIWIFSFPSPSTDPLIRVAAYPVVNHLPNSDPSISYTFTLCTNATFLHATTTLEYLTTAFLATCTESRDIYIKTFNLTHTLPSKSIPIRYNPSATTIYVENGIFLNPSTDITTPFKTGCVNLPPFFNEIQRLALPVSHFDYDILAGYDCVSPARSLCGDWPPSPTEPPAPSPGEDYNMHMVNIIGSLFSRLTSATHIFIVLTDEEKPPGSDDRLSERIDAEESANSMMEVLGLYKRDFYSSSVGKIKKNTTMDEEWKVPIVELLNIKVVEER